MPSWICMRPVAVSSPPRSTRTSASLPWRPCRRASACSRQTKEGTARRSSKARRDSCYLRFRMHSPGRFRSSTQRPFVRCEVPASRGRNPSMNPCFCRRCARSSPPPRTRCESARKGDIVKEGCRTSRPMAKSALVTGATGQDGSYLMELLLNKGYEVYGLVRRLSVPNTGNIQHIVDRVTLIDGDLIDQSSLNAAVKEAAPDEIYSLAAQSFVATSLVQPVLTVEITGLGVVRLLTTVRANAPRARLYQASSSEMFGRVDREPQDETTPFHPRSPYGVAKVYAYWACVNYREAHDLFISNGILFNHESERRGLELLTRKVSHGVARIQAGLAKTIALGNLDAKRDWGYAPEYVDLMWRILQHREPDDFVGATGEAHSVREFVAEAFRLAGISNWEEDVTMDDKNLRPSEVYNLRGDASKAKRILGWEAKTRFKDLVRKMVEAEIRALEEARPAS